MKHQSILFAAVAVLAVGAQVARAEGEEKKKHEGGHKGGDLLLKYDNNKDGALSKDEIAAIPEAERTRLLEKYDTNKDGELSKEEIAAMREAKHEKKEKAHESK